MDLKPGLRDPEFRFMGLKLVLNDQELVPMYQKIGLQSWASRIYCCVLLIRNRSLCTCSGASWIPNSPLDAVCIKGRS